MKKGKVKEEKKIIQGSGLASVCLNHHEYVEKRKEKKERRKSNKKTTQTVGRESI